MTKIKERKAKKAKNEKDTGFHFRDKIFYPLFFILIIFAAYLRFNHLTADPPVDLSWSLGPFTDEGHVVSDARDKLFFGGWNLDDFFRMGVSSFVTVVTFFIFKFFGYGFAQARLLPLFSSLLTILLVFLIIKREHRLKFAFLGSFFLGLNYVYLMHNRLALEETTLLLFIVLSIYFWQRRAGQPVFCLLAGLSLGCACLLVKIIGLFFVPILILDFLRTESGSLFKRFKLQKLKPILYFGGGFSLAVLVWLGLIFFPYKEDVMRILVGTSAKSGANRPETIFAFIKNFLTLGTSDRLFTRMPVVFILSFSFLLFWFKGLKEKLKSSTSIEFISVLWLFLGMLFLSFSNYHPIRYQMILIPPLCLLAGFSLGKLSELKFFKTDSKLSAFTLIIWWVILLVFSYSLIHMVIGYVLTHYQSFAPLISAFTSDPKGWFSNMLMLLRDYPALVLRSVILACIILFLSYLVRSLKMCKRGIKIKGSFVLLPVFVLILLFLVIQISQYDAWAFNVRYDLYYTSQDLRSLPPGSVIAGPWAGAVCLENNHRAIVMQLFANKDKVLERFKVTHLIIFQGGWEDKFFREDYPEVMKEATLLKQYTVRGNLLLLYEV